MVAGPSQTSPHDPLARAVAAGFALVASADRELDDAALERFAELVGARAEFPQVDARRAEHALRGVCQNMLVDPVRARDVALTAIRCVQGHAEGQDLVLRAALLARQTRPPGAAEEDALAAIRHALGVDLVES